MIDRRKQNGTGSDFGWVKCLTLPIAIATVTISYYSNLSMLAGYLALTTNFELNNLGHVITMEEDQSILVDRINRKGNKNGYKRIIRSL